MANTFDYELKMLDGDKPTATAHSSHESDEHGPINRSHQNTLDFTEENYMDDVAFKSSVKEIDKLEE